MRRSWPADGPGLPWLLHSQIGEVGLSICADPEPDRTMHVAEFKIVDDEAGLVRAIDVQPSFRAGYDDLHACPGADFQIRVGLVDTRRFLPQTLPGEFRGRDVLHR